MADNEEIWPPPSPKDKTSREPEANNNGSNKSVRKKVVADKSSTKEVWPPVPEPAEKKPRQKARSAESPTDREESRAEKGKTAKADEAWPPQRNSTTESSAPTPSSNEKAHRRPQRDSESVSGDSGDRPNFDRNDGPRKVTNPVQAVSVAFAKYAEFSGRSSRSEFWWFFGFLIVTAALISPLEPLLSLFFLGTLLPGLAVTVRRLRDAGFRWPWLLMVLVPLGVVVIIVLASQPSKRGPEELAEVEGLQRGTNPQDGRIKPLHVEQRALSSAQRTESVAWTFLAFLFSGVGLLARYIYLDSKQIWRNRFRQIDFAVVTALFVFATFGLGFVLTSFRWWGHSGERRFKKIAWLGVIPPILGTGFVAVIADWSTTGQTELGFPHVIGPYLLLIGGLCSFALAAMAAVEAIRMSRRLEEEFF